MAVVLSILVFFKINPGWNIVFFPFAILLILINGYWEGILLGILGTRFRDIVQIVTNVVQILFF